MEKWYVNCKDKYGYYLIMEVNSKKEAIETAAGMTSRNPATRVFSYSKTPAPPLTNEMMLSGSH